MPIYSYLCSACGHEFDEIGRRTDDTLQECRCGKLAERLPSAIGGYTGNFGSGSTPPRHKITSKNKLKFKNESN